MKTPRTAGARLALVLALCALFAVGCDDGGGSETIDASETGVDGTSATGTAADAPIGDGTGGQDSAEPPDGDATAVDGTASDGDADDMPDVEPPPPNERATSGTRLKAQYRVTEEGHRHFTGWWDSAEEAPCRYELATDGEYRCLPIGIREWRSSSDRVFGSSECSSAPQLRDAWLASGGRCPNPHLLSRDVSMCPDTRWRVETIGEATTVSTFYVPESDACLEVAQEETVFPLTERPPTDFVQATLRYEGGDPSVTVVMVDGEDGSSGWFGYAVPALDNHLCYLANAADGELRCLPIYRPDAPLVWEDLFVDSSCTEYAASAGSVQGCVSTYGTRYDDRGSCDPKFSIHEVLAPATAAMDLYRGSAGGSCEPVGQSAEGSYTTGPEIPASTFAAVVEVTPPASETRLTSIDWTLGPLELASWGYLDTELGEPCGFLADPTGTMRCMPGRYIQSAYGDAACTELLIGDLWAACAPENAGPYGRVQVQTSACEVHWEVRTFGAAYTGDSIWMSDGNGGCVDGGPSNGNWYVAGDALDPTTLVAGSTERDE